MHLYRIKRIRLIGFKGILYFSLPFNGVDKETDLNYELWNLCL